MHAGQTRAVGEREAPPEILAALRDIDSGADLVHLGGRTWWLGIRAPNPAARASLEHAYLKASVVPTIDDPAERAIMQQELATELRMRQIMADGFRPVAIYECEAGPGHDIVEDFRIRDFNWRTKTEDQVRRELKEYASIEAREAPQIQRWAEAAREAASEAWRYVFRRARSVLVGANLES